MSLSVSSILLAALLIACLGSFRWGMLKFFSQPAGATTGMKVISICGAASALLHLAAIVLTPAIPASQALAGALVYLCALGLFWWAISTNSRRPLSAAFSPDSPEHLVERGPYRLIRHPFYCSYLLAWGAGIVATGRLWLIPTFAVMLLIYLRAARLEEAKFTRSELAGRYARYRSRTGQLFPNPWKMILVRRPDDASEMAADQPVA
jgi:protein-S-isoprenylcysteine O-methyltransferase Ste14